MALRFRKSIPKTFLWATFCVLFFQEYCQEVLPVFPVNNCPENLFEVEAATLRLNCSGVKEFRNVYHCLPLSNLTMLVEFCYDGLSGLVEKGNCMTLENQHLNNHLCDHFTKGCPDTTYFPKSMFRFPACTEINQQDRCYLADPECPNTSFVKGTNTVDAIETTCLIPVEICVSVVSLVSLGCLILITWTCFKRRKRGQEICGICNRSDSKETCQLIEVKANSRKKIIYRGSLTIISENYTDELADHESEAYKNMRYKFNSAITDLIKDIPGEHTIVQVEFRKGSLMVKFDMKSTGYNNAPILYNTLNKAIQHGVISNFRVSPVGFKFETLQDMSLYYSLSPVAVNTSSITVPGTDSIYHIDCVTSDRLWVSDGDFILLVESSGHKIQKTIDIGFNQAGAHAVTEDEDLLFVNNTGVQKMMSDGTITTLIKQEWETVPCIHSSRMNSDILLVSRYVLMRFDSAGLLITNYQLDVYYPIFVTENKNGDIWVSDWRKKEVVVVDNSGQHRFIYRGQESQTWFAPYGICTDILGHVLVCDIDIFNPSVHLLNQDGLLLRYLLTKEHGLKIPVALCVDDEQHLYIGQFKSNIITVFKYLQEKGDEHT